LKLQNYSKNERESFGKLTSSIKEKRYGKQQEVVS